MEKATVEGIANVVEVVAHFADGFVGRTPFEDLQHLQGDSCEGFVAESDAADRAKLGNFGLKILDACSARVPFSCSNAEKTPEPRPLNSASVRVRTSASMASAMRR
jgi:hypothetical protein